MDIPEELRQEIMATFQIELEEHVGSFNKGLIDLEKGPEPEARDQLLTDLFRTAHNLKGSARAVGLKDIVTIANRLEDLLGAMRREELFPSSDLLDIMLPAVDALQESMDAHLRGEKLSVKKRDDLLEAMEKVLKEAPGPEESETIPGSPRASGPRPRSGGQTQTETPVRKSPIPSPDSMDPDPKDTDPAVEKPEQTESSRNRRGSNPRSAEDTVRVPTSKLDALMDGIGELLVARMTTEQRRSELSELQRRMSRWHKNWRMVRGHYNSLLRKQDHQPDMPPDLWALIDFLGKNEDEIKTFGRELGRLGAVLSSDHNRLSLLTDTLEKEVRGVRMLPLSTLFDPFPRMVRDLARERGKEINFIVEGASSEVDRHVLEAMKDPLTHLLRNAVDHGIETPEVREAVGKERQGTVLLRGSQKGNTIVIEVVDDGAGIELRKVRETTVRLGLFKEEEAEKLSETEIKELIFLSGLSTLDRATELSGRGVGLDVVKKNVEDLQGLIGVESIPGLATTFTLTLPLTLATNQVLLVDVGGETMGLPTTSVHRIERVERKDVGSLEGHPAIRVNGRILPLLSLSQTLGLERRQSQRPSQGKMPVVILGLAEKRMAFEVDGLKGTQEVVIKNMGPQLRRVPNVQGAAVLGNGQVVMILNMADLLRTTGPAPTPQIQGAKEAQQIIRGRILVVDDAITTRTLEKNILENAGYQVLVAADGEEGWAIIQSELLSAIVADVDMPRMDGVQLTEKVKGDELYRHLPVVLVTSLESRQDKIRGLEAGADAYITKQTFEQQELLETIERLIG